MVSRWWKGTRRRDNQLHNWRSDQWGGVQGDLHWQGQLRMAHCNHDRMLQLWTPRVVILCLPTNRNWL